MSLMLGTTPKISTIVLYIQLLMEKGNIGKFQKSVLVKEKDQIIIRKDP